MSEFIFCPDLTSADEYVLDNLTEKDWLSGLTFCALTEKLFGATTI